MTSFLKKPRDVKPQWFTDLYVTVFADASWCPHTKAGGFGGWCKYGLKGETFRVGARLPLLPSSTEAEIQALIHTLGIIIKEGIPLKNRILVVQTDCTGARDHMILHYPRYFPSLLECKTVTFKHVKGHQGNKNKRSSVNCWCDRTAKEHMLGMRKEIESKYVQLIATTHKD